MSETYEGACFCGAVEFEATGAPALQGYCHCVDCRTWLGAPVNAYTLWAPEAVKVTKGAENLGAYAKTERSLRKFCRTCGGAVMSEHASMGLADVFAVLMPSFRHEPTMHVHYGSKTLSVRDGLPKFRDLPAGFGSGETLPE